MSGINDIEKSLRDKIAKDLEELETPTGRKIDHDNDQPQTTHA